METANIVIRGNKPTESFDIQLDPVEGTVAEYKDRILNYKINTTKIKMHYKEWRILWRIWDQEAPTYVEQEPEQEKGNGGQKATLNKRKNGQKYY